jgi:hypothetical protein
MSSDLAYSCNCAGQLQVAFVVRCRGLTPLSRSLLRAGADKAHLICSMIEKNSVWCAMSNVTVNIDAPLFEGFMYYSARQIIEQEYALETDRSKLTADRRQGLVRLAKERARLEAQDIRRHLLAHAGRIPEAKPLFKNRRDLFEWGYRPGIWFVFHIRKERLPGPWYRRLLSAPPVTVSILEILYQEIAPSRVPRLLDRLSLEIPPAK